MNSLKNINLAGKKVFFKVDFNVPLQDGQVLDNNRIVAVLPTLEYLLSQGAKVIIGTHIGRPLNGFDEKFSTIPLASELAKLVNRRVYTTNEILTDSVRSAIAQLADGEILILGNLRFDYRESENDENFASGLASLADVFVNDGFAECHRAVASTVAITKFLPSYPGFLLEKEIVQLGSLTKEPARPFVLVIGGAKVSDKAGVIGNLINKVDRLLVGGAVGNTFLAASGVDIGKSLHGHDKIYDCQVQLKKFGNKIIIPSDAVFGEGPNGKQIFDIGPATIKKFQAELLKAKTVFWNGNLGMTEDERYQNGTLQIAQAIAAATGVKIAAGGDTDGFLKRHNLADKFTYISTGGGAALEFLAGKPLPGITALEQESR